MRKDMLVDMGAETLYNPNIEELFIIALYKDKQFGEAGLKGHTDMLRVFWSYKADVRKKDDLLLWLAAKAGQTDVVRTVLKYGANVHVLDDRPLIEAAARGHVETVLPLSEAGADFSAQRLKRSYRTKQEILEDYPPL
ncbi:hypothetical protein HK097_005937 [Rhizophlyctis rosea]|uniref:Ankyrin repeat domain-containing protein n=1 Tax=Rhizophlyctis rosea TaxID=64517 RepID=A0AAD5X6M9_9FUNG|nr:hypothetical protein HK097_005937 [Rhizophlyctis rosea]